MGEDDKKAAAPSKFNIISGSQHVIVSKAGLFQVVLLLLAALGGTVIAEKLRLQRNKARQRDLHSGIKETNKRLGAEKEDYKNIFGQMSKQLDDWRSAHDLNVDSNRERLASFKESSEALMNGLDDVRTVLEEKEFQLWEKEGLLEYQEERLLDSEDQEVQMALYINILARSVLALNLTLPEGLEGQPYYGESRARAPGDDDAQRRRRLRAIAADPAGSTGAYREFLLAQQAARQKK